jgi:hypothetical protein
MLEELANQMRIEKEQLRLEKERIDRELYLIEHGEFETVTRGNPKTLLEDTHSSEIQSPATRIV